MIEMSGEKTKLKIKDVLKELKNIDNKVISYDMLRQLGITYSQIAYLRGKKILGEPVTSDVLRKVIYKINIESALIKEMLSFGIEFENGTISKKGITRSRTGNLFAAKNKWSYQHDGTVAFEINTPVFTSIDEAVVETQDQWRYWKSQNDTIAPFPKCNYYYRNVGNHIHIGQPNKLLQLDTKRKLILKVIPHLPMLYFISANNPDKDRILSRRMLYSNFCKTLDAGDVIASGHSGDDISHSRHGTIEFRKFDGNFPQITLTCAYLLKSIAESDFTNTKNLQESKQAYLHDTKQILSSNIFTYLHLRKEMSNLQIKIPDFKFMREVLFISLKLGENPSKFMKTASYELCNNMFINVEDYCNNIIATNKNKHLAKDCTKISELAADMNTLKAFTAGKIIIRNKYMLSDVIERLKEQYPNPKEFLIENFEFKEKWLENVRFRQSKKVFIYRINEIPGITVEQAARIISEASDNLYSEDTILSSHIRFYYIVQNGENMGFIAVSLRDKQVLSENYKNSDIEKHGKAFLKKTFPNFYEKLSQEKLSQSFRRAEMNEL